tara:strand:+ start:936 stop:1364 length:429 start_codon:yes stop_codon:yes gene_type:complete
MLGLVGHRFPGGKRTIARWENYLLTDCTTSPQLDDGLVHPIALFHIPIQGVQTSIAELFEIGRVEGAGSVGLDGYDWEYFQPVREDVEYSCEGQILEVERLYTDSGSMYDRFVFAIELSDQEDQLVARATSFWRLRRGKIEH